MKGFRCDETKKAYPFLCQLPSILLQPLHTFRTPPNVKVHHQRSKAAFEAAGEDVLVGCMRCVQANTQNYPLIDDLPIAKHYRWSVAKGQGWRSLGFRSS